MKLYVVKTGDGPVYFKGDRNAGQVAAISLAAKMVCEQDSGEYDAEDREEVAKHLANMDWTKMFEALVHCYAITVAQTQN